MNVFEQKEQGLLNTKDVSKTLHVSESVVRQILPEQWGRYGTAHYYITKNAVEGLLRERGLTLAQARNELGAPSRAYELIRNLTGALAPEAWIANHQRSYVVKTRLDKVCWKWPGVRRFVFHIPSLKQMLLDYGETRPLRPQTAPAPILTPEPEPEPKPEAARTSVDVLRLQFVIEARLRAFAVLKNKDATALLNECVLNMLNDACRRLEPTVTPQ